MSSSAVELAAGVLAFRSPGAPRPLRPQHFPGADGHRGVRQDSILENIGDAIYGLAPDWTVTFFNRQAEVFFDCDRAQVLGRSLWDSFPAARGTELQSVLERVMSDRAPAAVVVVSPSTGRWADMRVFPLDDGGVGVSWRDVTREKQQERELQEALHTQDLLYRELTHRVMNNLQQVVARLTLQGLRIQDPLARQMLNQTADAVRCIALVCRRLYRSKDALDASDLGAFLQGLVDDLATGVLRPELALSVDAEPGVLAPADLTATLGMIVAELVTNADKHAWPAGERGHIWVTFRREGGTLLIEVQDDGRGLPDLDGSAAGLGLRLITQQVAGLNGIMIPDNRASGGASFRLRIPAP